MTKVTALKIGYAIFLLIFWKHYGGDLCIAANFEKFFSEWQAQSFMSIKLIWKFSHGMTFSLLDIRMSSARIHRACIAFIEAATFWMWVKKIMKTNSINTTIILSKGDGTWGHKK